MIGADTNVLLRILLDDKQQPEQVKAARQLAVNGFDAFYF